MIVPTPAQAEYLFSTFDPPKSEVGRCHPLRLRRLFRDDEFTAEAMVAKLKAIKVEFQDRKRARPSSLHGKSANAEQWGAVILEWR